eukprot:Opistho-2@69770
MATFATTFTSSFEKVCKFTESGITQSREVEQFIKKRLVIELEYAKQLSKLVATTKETIPATKQVSVLEGSRRPSATELFGSLTGTWFNVLEAAQLEANSHETYATKLGRMIQEPLHSRTKEIDAQRKQLVTDGQKLLKDLQEAYTALKKAQTLHDQMRREAEEAATAYDRAKNNHMAKEKDVQKLQSKSELSADKAQQSNRSLGEQDAVCNRIQEDHFRVKMPHILEGFQNREVERCRFLLGCFTAIVELDTDRFAQLVLVAFVGGAK